MVGIELPPTFVLCPLRLSSFCKISSATSRSALISGTTSSWSATFLNSTDELTAAVLLIAAPLTTFDNVEVGNGFGKAAGFLQVRELGNLETPIVLTNTLAVGTAVEAVVGWTLAQPGNEQVRSVNALVGGTKH